MTDVLVRRCTVRIVRRGGWGWGPRPRALVEGALRALPELLDEQFGDVDVGAYGDHEVSSTVRVTASIDADTLIRGDVRRLRAALAPPLGRALREAVATAAPSAPPELEIHGELGSRLPETFGQEARREGILARLVVWLDAGMLELVLALVADAVLERWHARLFDDETGATVTTDAGELEALVRALVGDAGPPAGAPSQRRDALRLRLALAAEIARRQPTAWPSAAALVAAAVPVEERRDAESEGAQSFAEGAIGNADDRGTARTVLRPAVGRSQTAPAEQRRAAPSSVVVPALPFLALVPLSRIGYLAALGSVLAAAGHAERASTFASALAYKVLSPPQRGWRRSSPDAAAAAAVSGSTAEPSSKAAALARDAESFASALDAVIAQSLIAGRDRTDPLLELTTRAGDTALVDPKGMFLLGIVSDTAPVLAAAGRPPVVRAPGAVGLDRERVDDVLAALDERVGVPLAEDRTLERTLTLAAALALAAIAWELWAERDEPTDPLLTLERFGDLEARIRVEQERLRVTLPLGRRYQDLADHALLGPVRDAPWLDGRAIEFDGG